MVNADAKELAKFSELAHRWWDPGSEFRPLHELNPLRLEWIDNLASLRGKRFEYQGIPVAVTYHPAYLLRNLPEKAKAWEDLLFARRCLLERLASGSAELAF